MGFVGPAKPLATFPMTRDNIQKKNDSCSKLKEILYYLTFS